MEEKDIQVIKGAVSESLKPVADEVKTVSTKVDTIEKGQAELKERISKIEKTPIIERSFNIGKTPKTFMGYKVDKQMSKYRDMAQKEKHVFDVFGDDEKCDDFVKFMIAFKEAKLKGSQEARQYLSDVYQKANMVEGTGANGGYLVPDEFLWNMCMLARNNTFGLQNCTVVPMNSDQMYIPAELTLASVAWTTPETGQISAGEPTFAQISLQVKRLDGLATVTNELLMDSAIDITSILSEQFGYAVSYELDNQILSGTGTPISGLAIGAAGYSVVFGTGSTNFSAVTAVNFSNAIYKLDQGDLVGAMFVINKIGMHYARTLRDANGQFIFAQPGNGVPGTIWEYPYFVSQNITSTSATSTALAVLGNFKKFYIGRRLGATSIDVDPYGKFDYYQTRFRIATRWALAVGRSTAFVRIMTAAA